MLADVLRRAGSGIKVNVGSFVKQPTVGNQDIPIPINLISAPAGSWAIMFWTSGSKAASGVWDSIVEGCLGFTTGPANSYATSCVARDALATTNTARRTAAKCLTMGNDVGSGIWWEADFVSFPDATHMRINWTTNDTDAVSINFMIISGLNGAKVLNTILGGSTGNMSVAGAGFSPDLVIHATGTVQSGATSIVHALMGLGVLNKHGQQWANSIWESDAVTPSVTSRFQQTDACLAITESDAITERNQLEASFSSMDASGYSMYCSVNNIGATWQLISLCLKGVSSKIGAFGSSTAVGTQVIPSRQSFKPKALLASSVNGPLSAVPVAAAYWTLGASDLVNSRSSVLADNDAKNPTEVDSLWLNDAVFAEAAGSTTESIWQKGTVSAVSEIDFSAAWGINSAATPQEWLYLLLGDPGVNTFPSKVVSVIGTDVVPGTATASSNQKKLVSLSTGRLVSVSVAQGGVPYAAFHYSDDGVTWTKFPDAPASNINGWLNGSISRYVDSGGIERIVAVWEQSGTSGGRTSGAIYVMVGTLDTPRTSITWGAAVQIASSAGGNLGSAHYSDIVVHAEGTGGRAHVVTSYNFATPSNYVFHNLFTIDAAGVLVASTETTIGGAYTANLATFPSIDINPTTKDLYCAWSSGAVGIGRGIRFKKATYSAGVWTWGAEVEVDNARYVDNIQYRWLVCRWDGTRVVIGGNLLEAGNNDGMIYESTNFTAFTTRVVLDNAVFGWVNGSMAIDSATGDVYFVGRGATSDIGILAYYKWTRSTLTLGARVVLAPSVVDPYVYAMYFAGAIRWIYAGGNNSPYSVKYDRLAV